METPNNMKKNNNVVVGAKVVGTEFAAIDKKVANSTRKFGKAFADAINQDLGATCAAINTHIDDEITLDGVTMSCRMWLATFGFDLSKMPNGLTAKVVKAVWNKEMTHGKDLCRWQIIPATVGEKVVYEYVETKKKDGSVVKAHKVVGKHHLVKVTNWSVNLLFRLLQESWNFAKVYNAMKDNETHLMGVKKFYVVESEKATRVGKSSKMAEVSREDIEW